MIGNNNLLENNVTFALFKPANVFNAYVRAQVAKNNNIPKINE